MGRKVRIPGAVAVGVGQSERQVLDQTGFTRARQRGDADEPVSVEKSYQVALFVLSPDEQIGLGGQVVLASLGAGRWPLDN